jgi:hypothetical protein
MIQSEIRSKTRKHGGMMVTMETRNHFTLFNTYFLISFLILRCHHLVWTLSQIYMKVLEEHELSCPDLLLVKTDVIFSTKESKTSYSVSLLINITFFKVLFTLIVILAVFEHTPLFLFLYFNLLTNKH